MKKTIVSLLVASAALSSAFSAAFTPGNLVVYRVGTGSAALSSASTAIFLDEYTTGGTLVQSIAVATTGTGKLTAAGTSTTEGMLTISPNGKYLSISGYDVTTGSASISSSTAANVPRAALVYDFTGSVINKATLSGTGSLTATSPRSAITVDGSSVYITGGNGLYLSSGTTTTQLLTTNLRASNIADGQLYVSLASGSNSRVSSLATALPTGTTSLVALPGLPTANSADQFSFFDLDSGVAGVDTLYLNIETGVSKYSLVGGTWTLNGTITLSSAVGLTAIQNGGTIDLYATTSTASTGGIYHFADTTGYNGTLTSPSFGTAIATVGTNKGFRGIAVVPIPEPSTYAIAIVSLLGIVVAVRRAKSHKEV